MVSKHTISCKEEQPKTGHGNNIHIISDPSVKPDFSHWRPPWFAEQCCIAAVKTSKQIKTTKKQVELGGTVKIKRRRAAQRPRTAA